MGFTKINVIERVYVEKRHSIEKCKKHQDVQTVVETTWYIQKRAKNEKEKEILSIKYTKNIFPRSTKDS